MNRLAQESSPYLQQHKDNPVDWYPWSEEAFGRARAEDRPVLLSVGYSTCHWCHVMAHESFEDEAVAALMNANFVNVKVDREERPDVDGVYMAAVQATTGQGGWPMTVFLTPDGEPFYAGTYFPPTDRYGMPGFARVLESVAAAWRDRRADLLEGAATLTAHLRDTSARPRGDTDLPADFARRGVENLRRVYDARFGGFGGAPKFPAPTVLEYLLSRPDGRDMAVTTLAALGAGGLYDQLGGGFHRYSVDERWLVPHFEKMLYDNAQLARTLLHAYQATGNAEFARVARETLAYLEREMRSDEGGFFSAQDADSEGVEGKFFVWTPQEVRDALGEPDAELVMRRYGVTGAGNFEDPHHPEFGRRSVLSVVASVEDVARATDLGVTEVEGRLERARLRLLEVRESRVHPGTDEKVLTSWNGLALGAFAEAARVLDEPHYAEVARTNAAFVRERLRLPDGGLAHTLRGGAAVVTGLLEDHALYALGLLDLYRAGGDPEHLTWARELWEVVRRDFWDEERGAFWSTSARAETLIVRRQDAFDSAVMSDNAAAALLAAWMERYFADEDAGRVARQVVRTFSTDMLAAPSGFGGLWQTYALLSAPHVEIAVLGSSEARGPLERAVAARFLPFVALAPAERGEGLPVLEGRSGNGVAYVCRNFACDLPARDVETLKRQLDALG